MLVALSSTLSFLCILVSISIVSKGKKKDKEEKKLNLFLLVAESVPFTKPSGSSF